MINRYTNRTKIDGQHEGPVQPATSAFETRRLITAMENVKTIPVRGEQIRTAMQVHEDVKQYLQQDGIPDGNRRMLEAAKRQFVEYAFIGGGLTR